MNQTAALLDRQLSQTLEIMLEPHAPMSPLLNQIADETPLGIIANDTEDMALTTADVSMLYHLGCSLVATTPPIEKPSYEPVVLMGKVKVKKYRKMHRERLIEYCTGCSDPYCRQQPGVRVELEEYEEEE